MNRRDFIVGAVGCAGAFCASGCAAVNPAPTVDAAADGSLAVPPELSQPGGQVKVRLPGADELVLVWRSDKGLGAASIECTHLGSEVHFNAAEGTLDCPSHGSRYAPDGKVQRGPAKRPLKPYVAAESGGRLTVKPAGP